MKEFYSSLSEWLKKDRLTRKVLLVGTESDGPQTLRGAAARGTPALNTVTFTVAGLIRELSAEKRRQAGLRVPDAAAVTLALQRLMADAKYGGAFETAGTVERATAERLRGMLEELEESGIGAEKLREIGKTVLADLTEDLDRWISENGCISRCRCIGLADPKELNCRYAIPANIRLTAAEKQFLDRIPSDRLTVLPVESAPEEERARFFRPFLQRKEQGEDRLSGPRRVKAQFDITEAKAILRRVLKDGIPAEQVAVLFPDAESALRFTDAAEALGIGVSSAFGKPVAGTRTLTALRALKDWADRDLEAEALTPALTGGCITVYDEKGNTVMYGIKLLRLLREKKVGWGAERWRALKERTEREDEPDKTKAARLLNEWIDLFESGRQPAERLAAKTRFLLKRTLTAGPANGIAENTLDTLAASFPEETDEQTLLELLIEALEGKSYDCGPDQPGKLWCTGYGGALFTDRKYIFVTGMDWDRLDRLTDEFPLLHDADKERLSPFLSHAGDRASERRYAILELVRNRPDAEISFSYAAKNDPGGEDRLPGSLFDPAERGNNGNFEKADVTDGLILTETDLLLRSGQPFAEGPEKTGESGSPDPELWREALDHFIFSPSALEDAMKCRFLFSCKRILGIKGEDPKATDRDAGTWLDALNTGNIAHAVLQMYFVDRINSGKNEVDEGILRSCFDEAVRNYEEEIPVPPAALPGLDGEKEKLYRSVLAVAEKYANDWERKALATEYRAKNETGDPVPVELTFGKHTIRMTGSIDRVDRTNEGIEIIDYKTGRPGTFHKSLPEKLQHYLYALYWEKTHPGDRVVRARYYLIDSSLTDTGKLDDIMIEEDDEKRKEMETLIDGLLTELYDPEKCFEKAKKTPEGQNDEADRENGNGSGKAENAGDDGPCKYCELKEFCQG